MYVLYCAEWIGTFYCFSFQIAVFYWKIIEIAWEKSGITQRCRLSGLTNSGLVYEPKCVGWVGGSRPTSTAVHTAQCIWSPNKLRRSQYLTYWKNRRKLVITVTAYKYAWVPDRREASKRSDASNRSDSSKSSYTSNSSDANESAIAMIPATAVTPAVAGMLAAAHEFCGDSRKNL
jgi:hypothetical protein